MPNSFKKIPAEMRGFFCRLLVEKGGKNTKDLTRFFFCYDFLVEYEGGDILLLKTRLCLFLKVY